MILTTNICTNICTNRAIRLLLIRQSSYLGTSHAGNHLGTKSGNRHDTNQAIILILTSILIPERQSPWYQIRQPAWYEPCKSSWYSYHGDNHFVLNQEIIMVLTKQSSRYQRDNHLVTRASQPSWFQLGHHFVTRRFVQDSIFTNICVLHKWQYGA